MSTTIDFNTLISNLVTMQMMVGMLQSIQQAFSGSSGMGGLTKTLEEIIPLILIMKLFEKM